MKKLHLLLILSQLSIGILDARIGETREQCIERYGQDTGRASDSIRYDKETVSHHKVDELGITLYYLGGVAYKIAYTRLQERKRGELLHHHFSDTEIKGLIKKNLDVEMMRRKEKDKLPWKIETYGQSKYSATEVWESENGKFTCEHEFTSGEPVIPNTYIATVTITDNTIESVLRDMWLKKKMEEHQQKELKQAEKTLKGL
jgi:hypothetical protein